MSSIESHSRLILLKMYMKIICSKDRLKKKFVLVKKMIFFFF
jgi:hypothetical protein